jgi:hypothetical protein
VQTRLQGDQDIQTTAAAFHKTADGDVADIAVGDKLLVATGGREVIMLADDAEIGREVTRVTDEGFTVSLDKGRSGNVKAANVEQVYTLTPAQGADAKVGTGVIIAGRRVGTDGFQAVDVIVLPTDSAFNA